MEKKDSKEEDEEENVNAVIAENNGEDKNDHTASVKSTASTTCTVNNMSETSTTTKKTSPSSGGGGGGVAEIEIEATINDDDDKKDKAAGVMRGDGDSSQNNGKEPPVSVATPTICSNNTHTAPATGVTDTTTTTTTTTPGAFHVQGNRRASTESSVASSFQIPEELRVETSTPNTNNNLQQEQNHIETTILTAELVDPEQQEREAREALQQLMDQAILAKASILRTSHQQTHNNNNNNNNTASVPLGDDAASPKDDDNDDSNRNNDTPQWRRRPKFILLVVILAVFACGCATFVVVGSIWGSRRRRQNHSNMSTFDEESANTTTTPLPFWNQVGPDIYGQQDEEQFGYALDLSADGTILVASAILYDAIQYDMGQVRIYHRVGVDSKNDTSTTTNNNLSSSSSSSSSSNYEQAQPPQTWILLGEPSILSGTKAGDFFGYELSLSPSGKYLAIAAPRNGAGTVRVWKLHDDTEPPTWQRFGSDLVGHIQGEHFGKHMELNDNLVLAISSLDKGSRCLHVNVDDAVDYSHVSIFQFNETIGDWVPKGQRIQGESINDWFGISFGLAQHGNMLVVGAPKCLMTTTNGTENNSTVETGCIYTYRFNDEKNYWIRFDGNDDGSGILRGKELSGFGYSVVLSAEGLVMAASAPWYDSHRGYVNTFRYADDGVGDGGAKWINIMEDSNISGDQVRDQCGSWMAISDDGSALAVGGGDHNRGTGQVQVFHLVDNMREWIQRGPTIEAAQFGDAFGFALALSGDGFMVAASSLNARNDKGYDTGAVRVFEPAASFRR